MMAIRKSTDMTNIIDRVRTVIAPLASSLAGVARIGNSKVRLD